jgi:hypothetical protein
MSDLLNKASLVVIPSGYKEDTVYSAVPTDGSGDLSFTRASNGTRVNSAGLVEVCPWNNCTNTETFSSTWTALSGASVTANSTTAPNGTTTGGTLAVPSTAFAGFIQTIPDNTQTISLYAKKGTLDYLWFIHENISQLGASFNLDTGVVSFVASGHTASMESVGNGWYRCILSTTNSATWDYFQFGLSNASNSATSPSGGNAYIWGAQANIGSTAKPYFPTTDRLNVPRLTYQNGGGGCPSLLLEKQSTNMVRNWNFTASVWDKNSITIVSNSGPSPDGTNNAFLIYPTSSGTDRFLYDDQGSASYSANADYTTTVYAKAAGLNFAYIRFENKSNANSYVYFNLSTGVVGSTTGSVTIISKTIESMGNGWYRLRVTANMGTGSGGANNVLFGVADADGSTQATTSGTNGVLFYGPQSEQSSYPTSPIQTSGSTATRVADACYKTGISSLIGQTEGVVFWDIQVETLSATGNENILNIDAGSYGNTLYFIKGATGVLSAEIYVSGVLQCSFSHSLPSVGRYKMALAYKANDFAFYVNGVQRGTDSSGSVPAMSRFQLGNGVFGPSDGKTNQAILFPTRLTNAELASLTTI